MCFMDTTMSRATTTDAFSERMIDMLNGSSLVMMISVGHRTGLFDTMAGMRPATSTEIADAAGLNERYVREWLGAMTTGRIVEHDARQNTYYLPETHAAVLTRAASPNNLAVTCQFLPLLGSVEDRIVDCFRRGGGVPYAAFPRFQDVMAEESNQTVGAALMDSILPLAPGVIEDLEAGIDVLEIGCGSGGVLNRMAMRFPNSRFTGYDLSHEGIAAGREEARRMGLPNARFEVRDVAAMTETDAYDLITAFDAIHDQAWPTRVLDNIVRALRPTGTFLMQDIGGYSSLTHDQEHPLAPTLYTISCMHCMTVSLAAGGEGLGAMWGRKQAETMLRAAGFTHIAVRELPHDVMNVYFVARRRVA